MGPSLLLCKVNRGRRWGVELHPETGTKEPSLQFLPTGSHTCTHTRTHTAKTLHTGVGSEASRARMAGQGGRRSRWSHSEPATLKTPAALSLQHLSPGLGQLQGQRTTEGKRR